ncbi:MAG: rod shape-determining protein MreC [Candidatus Korobacteraceae bacterium]
MDTFLGRYKNLIVLAAILFVQIIALAVQVHRPTQGGDTRLLRLWAISAVTPVETAVVHAQKWVNDTWNNYAYLRGVRRENRELRAEIERMKVEDARYAEDARMARRIQALLAFKEQYVDTTVAAQVIGTSGSEQSRILYLDKGSNDGIKPDMAVITPAGIVGKIVQVFPDSSQVLPINDQFSGVGAALKSSRLQGILRGSSNGVTTLQYVMSDEKVEPGEEVITSGGDRIFPKGLPVGKVVSVEPGKDLFLNIRVVPSARLDQVEEVLIVTKITEKMPDSKDLGPLRASDILAERLPTVPAKPEVDATGKPKPGAASGTTPGATPATGTTAAHAGAAATPAANKPAIGSSSPAAPKTNGAASAAHGAPSGTTAGSAGAPKAPKPAAASGTRPAGTVAKPLNGTGTETAPHANTSAPAPGPSPANRPANGNQTTPPSKQSKPAPEQTPNTNPQQPSTPPNGEQPPQ